MTERDPWKELEKLAREINPNLPTDLSNREIRITLNRDYQGVECYVYLHDGEGPRR